MLATYYRPTASHLIPSYPWAYTGVIQTNPSLDLRLTDLLQRRTARTKCGALAKRDDGPSSAAMHLSLLFDLPLP